MSEIQKLREKLLSQPLERSFPLERAAVDEESRTVSVAFASDRGVDHWFGTLILSMDKKAMRSERLKSGAALLMDHNWRDQVGVVENFSIEGGVARADVRFSRSSRGEEVYQDVVDGIRQNISFGFIVHDLQLESENKGEMPVYRSNDWEPYEISIVSVPADISVGVGRSKEFSETAAEVRGQIQNNMEKNMTENNEPVTPVVATPPADTSAARHAGLIAFGDLFGEGDLARQLILADPDATREDLRQAIITKRDSRPSAPAVPQEDPQALAIRQGAPVELARTLPRHGKLRNFKDAERAYRFGQWVMAAPMGVARAAQFCRDHGLEIRAMSEGQNEYGGFLVPEEFGNDLIDLREQYGVFRRNAKVVPMSSDTRSDPRRTGGLTAYFVNEADAITASDKSWDRVNLVAKKLGVLARVSSELNEDSVISLGDDLAGEMAYAFANKEDECGFNGDGTSTYGGIVGACAKIKGLSATIAYIAGLQVGTGNAYSELTLTDFEGVVGRLPQYADTPSAKWFVHRSFYYNVMVKVMLASGGVTASEIEQARNKQFLGYEVEFAQVMPKVEANSQVCALLGDLSLAASLGSRRETTITMSEHSRFANDQIEFKGTERFDINVHSVGNADATAANRVTGPIVGLITAAS